MNNYIITIILKMYLQVAEVYYSRVKEPSGNVLQSLNLLLTERSCWVRIISNNVQSLLVKLNLMN